MTSLVLRLAGPLQSWGASSRFVRRGTELWPTKSAVVGLLASAMGRRRTDPIEDLLGLRFAVRVDQRGVLVRDLQTARSLDGTSRFPLSYRYYLSDAVFLAVVEGDDHLVGTLSEALRSPAFPLYLGRRSCPPAGRYHLGTRSASAFEVLTKEPWQASPAHRSRFRGGLVRLEVVADSDVLPAGHSEVRDSMTLRDAPVSFDPELRQYGWRSVVRTHVTLEHDDGTASRHDPMAIVGG